jgi:hypothetical protein
MNQVIKSETRRHLENLLHQTQNLCFNKDEALKSLKSLIQSNNVRLAYFKLRIERRFKNSASISSRKYLI